MNQQSIIGNLTKDAEEKKIGEKNYNVFTVAVNEGRDADGNERTSFIQVLSKIYGEQNRLLQYLTKGTKVFVQGRPTVKAWQKNDGSLVVDQAIWSDMIELLQKPADATGTPDYVQQAAAQAAAAMHEDNTKLPF